MPAKSKDQQRAAAIALKAKREGTIDDLPSGAAKNMAKSMSEKELDKFASTKHKGLPENKPNEHFVWAGESLQEVFAEEMLGTDEAGEAIASDKPTIDQIEDAGRETEDDTGWDSYDDSWDGKVHGDAPVAQSGRPMGSNVMGASRVSFESVEADSQTEVCDACNGTGLKDGHGDQHKIGVRDIPYSCSKCRGTGKIKKKELDEVAPKGWEGTVKAMKKHSKVDNPWALANWMKNKGYKSHKESYDPNSLDILFESDKKEESKEDLIKKHRGMAAAARGVGATHDADSYDRTADSLEKELRGPVDEQHERDVPAGDEYYDLTHSSDWEDDRMDDPYDVAQGEVDYEALSRVEQQIKDEVQQGLDWAKRHPEKGLYGKAEPPSLELAIDIADNELTDLDEWSWQAEELIKAYGDKVDSKDWNHPSFARRALAVAAKEIGQEVWEEWSQGLRSDRETEPGGEWDQKTSDRPNLDIDEQAIGGLDLDSDWADDWGSEFQPDLMDVEPIIDPAASELENRMHSSMIDDMAEHIITHYDLHGKLPSEWSPEELLMDFEYDYSVNPTDPSDLQAAEDAIKRAKEEVGDVEEVRFESKRWQKLAGIQLLSEEKSPLKEMSEAQLIRYVKRMAINKWDWLDVANKLTSEYGVTSSEIRRLQPVFETELERLQQEAVIGGVSNGGPAPGHRAKMNEDEEDCS